jgi:hypothetical protein
MDVLITATTDGKGHWSEEARAVDITKLKIGFNNQGMFPGEPFYGELQAYFEGSGFTKNSWNVRAYGLIYTDKQWLREFRAGLRAVGFSRRAVQDVQYSEQGMQGDDYVSFDIGAAFWASWKRVQKLNERKLQDAVANELTAAAITASANGDVTETTLADL